MEKKNKIVFQNTIFLYARTVIITIASLFSVRLVLSALGEIDYGTYNVVAGFVAMFTFVVGVMVNSSQRHFSIYLANNDWKAVNKMFSVNLVIYIGYVIILLILAETVGLWFVINHLNYPPEQIGEVIWVYQFSIVTSLLGILSAPFTALLVANEHMFVYSIVSILEALGKIGTALLLTAFSDNRMLYYGLFVLIVALVVNGAYVIYSFIRYKQLRIYFVKEKFAYKEVLSFLNWNLIGGTAAALKGQGVNIVMNINFGSAINTPRGIAFQVNSAVSSFSQNFMKAIDPRITKAYTEEDKTSFNNYVFTASKLSFYLLMVLCLPLIFNMSYVTNLWLGKAPDYTNLFVTLVVIESLVLSVTDPLLTGVQATGKVKHYQIIVGGLSLLNLPLSYLFIFLTNDPICPFLVAICIALLITAARITIFKKLVPAFSVTRYLIKVMFPMIMISAIVCVADHFWFGNASNFGFLVLNCAASLLLSLVLIFFIGITKEERQAILRMFKRKKHHDESV